MTNALKTKPFKPGKPGGPPAERYAILYSDGSFNVASPNPRSAAAARRDLGTFPSDKGDELCLVRIKVVKSLGGLEP